MHDPDQESQYAGLDLPEFESSIPEHTLQKMREEDQFLFEKMSIMSQKVTWLVEEVRNQDRIIWNLNRQLRAMESWKSNLAAKWSVITLLLTCLSPALFWVIKSWLASPGSTLHIP